MVFVRYPFERGVKCVDFSMDFVSFEDLNGVIAANLGNPDFFLYHKGQRLIKGGNVARDGTVHVIFSLPGGKGGFGSMLRAIGAQIEKTTNREACRDLSGRRLRDINEEQRLKRWIAKEAEREEEKMRRRKERLERLKSKPKHNFVDFEYEKEISQLPERIDEALNEGLQKAPKALQEKREAPERSTASKKKRLWLDEDLSNESSCSDSEARDKSSSSEDKEVSDQQKQMDQPTLLRSEAGTSSSSEHQTESSVSSDINEQGKSQEMVSMDCKTIPEDTKAVETESSRSKAACTSVVNVIPCQNLNEENVIEGIETTENSDSQPCSSIGLQNEDNSPIDLLAFQSISELEALGLERLKFALMARNLKCGGSISDRAQRLWKVRGLRIHEYPTNLLAKRKK